MILLLASLALADSITLDTGATIEGDLARYEYGGDCQLSVTEGELTGVILIVPCHRVQSFTRTALRTPVPIGLEAEATRVVAASGATGSDGAVPGGAGSSGVAIEDAGAPVIVEEAPVAGPLAEPDGDQPFYDEPLFPADATTPITPAATPITPAAQANPAPHAIAAPPIAAPRASVAPPAPMETTGPRLAPRLDEEPPPSDPSTSSSRAVSF